MKPACASSQYAAPLLAMPSAYARNASLCLRHTFALIPMDAQQISEKNEAASTYAEDALDSLEINPDQQLSALEMSLEATPASDQPTASVESAPVSDQPLVSVESTPFSEQPPASVESTPVSDQPSASVESTPVSDQPSASVESTPVSDQPSASVESTPVSEQKTASAPVLENAQAAVATSSYGGKTSMPANGIELPTELPEGYSRFTPIGKGAQATVFKAYDKNGGEVAVKCFDKNAFANWKDEELLRREVEVIRELDVKGIPKYIDFVENNRYAFLIESFIPAPSLADRIEQGFRPTANDIVKIISNATEILVGLEDRLSPVIHRDIKPANILIDDELNVFIVDFGVVAAIRQHTIGMTFAGTAGYLAPEQLYGRVTPAADIFGLGASMAHLITGVAPCDMEMSGLRLNLRKYIPSNTPAALIVLLYDMVEPDPGLRIPDAQELKNRLASLDLRSLKVIKSEQKRKERLKKLTVEERIALHERVKERNLKRSERIARTISGPRAKKDRAIEHSRKLFHQQIEHFYNIYQFALFRAFFQAVWIAVFLIGATGIDLMFVKFVDGWISIRSSHCLLFASVASVLSCLLTLGMNHLGNRGLLPLSQKSDYFKRFRKTNRLVNDIYVQALLDDNSDYVGVCNQDILHDLHWELARAGRNRLYQRLKEKASGSEDHASLDSVVEIGGESAFSGADAVDFCTSSAVVINSADPDIQRQTLLYGEAANNESLAESDDKSGDLVLPESNEYGKIVHIPEESNGEFYVFDDYCIACPPKKVSVLKLILVMMPMLLPLMGLILYYLPFCYSSMELNFGEMVVYMAINSVALLAPLLAIIFYVKTRLKYYYDGFEKFKNHLFIICGIQKVDLSDDSEVRIDLSDDSDDSDVQ